MKRSVLCCYVLLVAIVGAEQQSKLVNKMVTTTLDLTSHLAKYTTSVTLENADKTGVSTIHFLIDPKLSTYLDYFSVQVDDSQELKLKHHVMLPGRNDEHVIAAQMNTPLLPGATIKLRVVSIYGHAVQAHPAKIVQSDKQLVLFVASGVYYYSPYVTESQTLTVTLPSGAIVESFTRVKPVNIDGSVIVYGPYTDSPAFTTGAPKSLILHYENNSPMLVVVHLDRLIEISHWGNIAVEETIQVNHVGAQLKGAFSRYDYQRNPNSGQWSVKSYRTLLPAAARDVYYRDEIGNISTSHMRVDEDAVEIELRPRFPLFGGWQTKYTIGYNVPGYEYLWHTGSHFVLRMRILDHVFDEQLVDHLSLRIILPEGAQNIQFKSPYPMDIEERHTHHTYLDTVGRPVVVINKKNLVEQHIQDFELTYDFQLYQLLQEPLLVVCFLLAIFLSVIVCIRLDPSITEDKVELSRQQLSVLVDELRALHDQRLAEAGRLDAVIGSHKNNKDAKKFHASSKELLQQFEKQTNSIATVLKSIAELDADCANKGTELQKKAAELLAVLRRLCELADHVVGEKMRKEKYVEEERKVQDKRRRLLEEMDVIARGL